MAGYYRSELPNVPNYRNMDFGAGEMLRAGEMLSHSLGRLKESELADAKRAEDQKRYETELGYKQRQEQRAIDALNMEQATREAIQAQLTLICIEILN